MCPRNKQNAEILGKEAGSPRDTQEPLTWGREAEQQAQARSRWSSGRGEPLPGVLDWECCPGTPGQPKDQRPPERARDPAACRLLALEGLCAGLHSLPEP